jgi:hypothetical protein
MEAKRVWEKRTGRCTVAWGADPWDVQVSAREPGNVVLRVHERALRRAIWRAQFRCRLVIDTVVWGDPSIRINSGARKSPRYTVSANATFFPMVSMVERGMLYLSTTFRVRQGRGNSLVAERLCGKKWTREESK